MPPNVPGAWLSHQMPPAKSCWGAGFGTLHSWGGERKGAQRGRHTCLSQVHSLKVSIYSKMMPWFCSETHLCLGVTKEQAVVSKFCLAPSHPQHSFCCVLLVNGHPWTCHSSDTAFPTSQCNPTRDPNRWMSPGNCLDGIFQNVLPFFFQKRWKPKWGTAFMTSKVLWLWNQHANFKVHSMCLGEVTLCTLPLHANTSHLSSFTSSSRCEA